MAKDDPYTLKGLQVLRAFAALIVVVHHALVVSIGSSQGNPPTPLVLIGTAGVDIFFVISGFIMMAVTFANGREPDRPGAFISKRVARIYPLYWVAAGVALLAFQFGLLDTMRPPGLTTESILRALALAPTTTPLVPVAWTLIYEMNFYLLFALMLFARNRVASLVCVTALILIQLPLATLAPDQSVRKYLGDPIMLEFCFGMALGYAYLRGWLNIGARWYGAAAALALAIIALAPLALQTLDGFVSYGLTSERRVLVFGLPSVALVAFAVNWRIGAGWWSRTWLLMGNASYAIYLLHPFVMVGYGKALGRSKLLLDAWQPPLIIAMVVLSAAFGVAAHLLLERPLTRAARRLLRPKRTREPLVAAHAERH